MIDIASHRPEPGAAAPAIGAVPGIDYLRAWLLGDVSAPALLARLGIRLADAEVGRVALSGTPAADHYNPLGVVHGGVTATLCDSALAYAILSALPAGVTVTTLELSVRYLRAITAATGPVRCEGRALHVGGRVATAEARLIDGAGALYAHATCTCLVLR